MVQASNIELDLTRCVENVLKTNLFKPNSIIGFLYAPTLFYSNKTSYTRGSEEDNGKIIVTPFKSKKPQADEKLVVALPDVIFFQKDETAHGVIFYLPFTGENNDYDNHPLIHNLKTTRRFLDVLGSNLGSLYGSLVGVNEECDVVESKTYEISLIS